MQHQESWSGTVEELCYLSATQALQLFRSRRLSPVELMDAVITRAEAVEPRLNAFAEQMFDEALSQARQAEARYAGHGAPPRPLEGLPVALKEALPVAGWRWTEGSLVLKERVASETHPVAARIMAAGGIIHGQSTTPEFSCAGFTHSRLWGVTRNPWNMDYSPGGSSGGSAAALAAGTAVLATGTDIAGSIRLPAAFCGVVGYKPPYGRVPSLPPENLDHYNHVGPLARTVADCALLQNVIAGPHARDVASLPATASITSHLNADEGLEGCCVALCLHLGDYPVESDVARTTRNAAEALRQAGARVDEVALNWQLENVMEAWWLHAQAIFGPRIRELVGERLDLVTPYIHGFIEQMNVEAKDTSLRAARIESALYAELGPLLQEYDVLLCPTTSVCGLIAGDDYNDKTLTVGDRELSGYGQALMTTPFNLLSRCPVLAVPAGRTTNNLPTGVQIVGAPYEDEAVFRVGAVLERVRPWFDDDSWRPSL